MVTAGSATTVWTRDSVKGEKRDLWTAMKRGFRCRCPRCGEGKLFRAFLKVDNNCSACVERMVHNKDICKGRAFPRLCHKA